MDIVILGIVAGALQAVGYLVYGFKVLKRDITPNATSWMMFAYGTTFLVVLEWDRDASLALLALPVVCALSSIGIAWYCLRKARRTWWPEHRIERLSFFFDVLLTIAYLYTWVLLLQGSIGEQGKDWAEFFILICWNVGIFTAFFPLLRQVYRRPASEHAAPWLIWTCAYTTLAFVTLAQQQGLDELILYPVINTAIHGFIAARIIFYHLRNGQMGKNLI